MTSRLTLSALVFAIMATVGLVGVAQAGAVDIDVTQIRVVHLERVVVTMPR